MANKYSKSVRAGIAAVALGAAVAGGCRSANPVVAPITAILESHYTKEELARIRKGTDYHIEDYLKSQGIPLVGTKKDYRELLNRAQQRPQVIFFYVTTMKECVGEAEWFVNYRPEGIEKWAVRDDAVDFRPNIENWQTIGWKNVVVLYRGNTTILRHTDLPTWVSAYKLALEKEAANK